MWLNTSISPYTEWNYLHHQHTYFKCIYFKTFYYPHLTNLLPSESMVQILKISRWWRLMPSSWRWRHHGLPKAWYPITSLWERGVNNPENLCLNLRCPYLSRINLIYKNVLLYSFKWGCYYFPKSVGLARIQRLKKICFPHHENPKKQLQNDQTTGIKAELLYRSSFS